MNLRVPGLILAVPLALACASDPPTAAPPAAAVPDEQRVEELLVEIRRDRFRVIELLAEPIDPEAPPLRESSEMQALARRLPVLQEELRALGGQRRLLEAETLLPEPVAREAVAPESATTPATTPSAPPQSESP